MKGSNRRERGVECSLQGVMERDGCVVVEGNVRVWM